MSSLITTIISLLCAPCVFNVLYITIILAPLISAVPHPIIVPSSPLHDAEDDPAQAAYRHAVAFAVACPGCFNGPADAALPFELVHDLEESHECDNVSLTLNGQSFNVDLRGGVDQASSFNITTANETVALSVQGFCDTTSLSSLPSPRQVLFFDIDPLDGASRDTFPSFTVVFNATLQAATLVIPHPHPDTTCLSLDNEHEIASALFPSESEPLPDSDGHASTAANSSEESTDSENPPAKELRKRFEEERELIRRLTMDCRTRLSDDLQECNHDVKCSGKAICQHIRHAVMDLMATIKSSLQQSPLVSDERQWQAIVADEKNLNYGTDPTSHRPSPEHTDKQSIIILVLEVLAGVLGVTGLLSCIRRKCRSFRRRTERLADREERRRAREYRRLARKEAIRKRWVAFRALFRLPCRQLDCGEKQALVLEAASFATGDHVDTSDIEQAWQAVISEGRLSSNSEINRSSQHAKYEDSRSRSDSLPSYGSEKLPDYSSQPDDDVFIVDGYRVYTPSLAGSSANTAITPDSSVPDLSPRCSRETLRTLMSRDYDASTL
ncbi:hypothetical protein AAFC00_002362 [Neodothiora populina]|uniref:Uncharacterized protein n=1 Tax=Neodothiora populina TaxID=2781224 RepID=A0ABR3PH73_9PEZI